MGERSGCLSAQSGSVTSRGRRHQLSRYAGSNATVADYSVEEFRQIVELNLLGTFHVNKAVVDTMRAQNYGRIVNIASVAGKEGNPNASAYSASKAAVIGFTKSLGKELANVNVAVNCVTSAAARTRIFDQMSQEHIDFMLSEIPRARFLELDEAAAMIAWLASAENSFTTASTFDLSGGRATYWGPKNILRVHIPFHI